ncbi:MAG TPA: hypothetical protein VFL80_07230, partial [Thermoanaerobaculia bacterium]|nr:hypothetical protein [Thermoanaerobaculia bacterium]
ADALLDVQYVRSDERVYDDTGWTLGYLKNVDFKRIANPEVLKVAMSPWKGEASRPAVTGAGPFAVESTADNDLARFRWAMPKSRFAVAEEEFTAGGKKFARGTVVITPAEGERLPATPTRLTPLGGSLSAKTREMKLPRIAILHTWIRTQDEGWYRLALESMGVPYTYISTQDVSRTPNLREQFDVILFPPSGGDNPQQIVNGLPAGPPLPWKKTDLTPNLGVDETDDMRQGLGLSGVASLQRFVEEGGLLITVRDTASFAIHYGLARYVDIVRPNRLKAPGTILAATVTDRRSPVTSGYDETVPLYYAGSPIFRVGVREEREPEGRPSGRGTRNDPDVPQGRPYVPFPERPKPAPEEEGFQLPEDLPGNFAALMPLPQDRPRVLVAFKRQADQLLLSGMLDGGDEIAGKPAVVLAPRGKGNILLFAINPMWRMNTQGAYPLVMNAIMNWDALR